MGEQSKYSESTDPGPELDDADAFDPLFFDPVIEVYKKDVDRTILRENLKLSPQERSEKFQAFMRNVWRLREAARRSHRP